MCGIAGFSGSFDSSLLERMNRIQQHRGPDGDGVWFDKNNGVGLAHRRLSIQDLSTAGHQPMYDATKTVLISFNGEIYNFKEIRAELKLAGFVFNSKTDTEVLLNLYLRDGINMLSKLNGVFTFAIWDTRSKALFVARDGVGVKPLYYAKTTCGVIFASEMKSLFQEPSLRKNIDTIAVAQYLSFLWSPSPRTMLSDVKKLEPGKAMLLRNGLIESEWQHYDLPQNNIYFPHEEIFRPEDIVEKVRVGVQSAVQRQMISDVPVGAFLSGGLDSSAIVNFARDYSKERLQCFTIDFNGKGIDKEGFANDLPYAERVAKHLDVDLNVITVGSEMADHLQDMVYALDEPQADPAALNLMFISKFAQEQGIKVLLSGAGGDDIFTGYRRHYALQQERYWSWLPHSLRYFMRLITSNVSLNTPLLRRLSKAFAYADSNTEDRLVSYFLWQRTETVKGLFTKELQYELDVSDITYPLDQALTRCSMSSDLERMLYLEGKYFLADHNLNYTDKMSMAYGVEVRVPFLDPELIALAANIPNRFKQNGRIGKWALKKAMEPYLPKDIIYRPKTGFGVPLRHWIKHEMRDIVNDFLSLESLKKRGLFDPVSVQRLIQLNDKGKIDAAYPILSLLSIEMWCRSFLD